MKLLFYITPWLENDSAVNGRSQFTLNEIRQFLQNYAVGLSRQNRSLEVKIVCPKNGFLTPETYVEDNTEIIPIRQIEVDHIFPDHQSYMKLFELGEVLPEEAEVIDFFRDRLRGFKPDIVIGLTPCHFFKKIWHDAACFTMEAGFFSRAPFPLTQYFDTAKHLSLTLPNLHKEKILEHHEGGDFADTLFTQYKSTVSAASEISRLDLDPESEFEKIVLVPLQFEGCPSFDHCCDFKNQYEFAAHILENIPSDVLVVFTRHQFTVLDEELLDREYGKTHKNFRLIHSIKGISEFLSQHILPHVDGVITISSSIGFQAAIWGKFCICIGNSHVQAFADSGSLADLPDLLSQHSPSAETKTLISFLLKHYYVPFDFLTDRPDWCRDYFDTKLRLYDKDSDTQDISFYPPVMQEDDLMKYYLEKA